MRAMFLEVGGVRTRCLVAGEEHRSSVLLIHGFGLSADVWVPNIKELGRRFHVIAPDMIGHGFTGAVSLNGAPPHQVYLDHLVALAAKLGLSDYCPVGSSFGALMAALLHLRDPRAIRKLVIVGSGSCFNNDDEQVVAAEGAYKNQAPMMENPTYEICHARMANIVYDVSTVPEALLQVQMTAYAQPEAHQAWAEGMMGMMQYDEIKPFRIYSRLEQIAAETLIVWGKQDKRGIYSRAVEAARRIPDARLIAFDECGHFPALEESSRFNSCLADFLEPEKREAPVRQ